MSVPIARHGAESPNGRFLSKRWVPAAAMTTAALLTVGAIATAGGGSAGAAAAVSQATGRFLSGTVGNQSLDVLAGVEGESATNPGDPGPNQNKLNVELLNNALRIPLGDDGLQLPDPTSGAVELGAVAQYARADGDGSALGASGAVDSNGGIGVGGSNGVPKGGATLDLSGSAALSAITSSIADLKLSVGAVSARAQQAAVGDKLADPSASCTNGGYHRVGDASQGGKYNIAGLGVDLTSPLLAQVGSTLVSTVDGLLTTANITSILGVLNGGPLSGIISVTGVPDVATLVDNLLDLSLAGGAITLSLETGSLHVDLADLLKFAGLDINNLCPNTSLLPYVVDALVKGLPSLLTSLISDLSTTLTNALGDLTITILGVPISANLLTNLLTTLGSTIGTTLNSVLGNLDTSLLQPLLDVLSANVLNIVVNAQSESGGTLTVTALQLNLLPGGQLAVPGIRSVKTLPAVRNAKPNSLKVAHQVVAEQSVTVKPARVDAAAHAALAPTSAPLVGLNLAQASVGPHSQAPAASSPPGSPSPSTSVPATNVPTGVPAGEGTHGSPVLPITLLALGLAFAAGGVLAFRFRGTLNRH